MAKGQLANLLAGLDRQVFTFDPPGAYSSTRPMQGDMAEMLACAEEALELCQAPDPVDVVGHSMGGLCALGLAIEHPQRVKRLVLIGACSGFPAVFRWSVPHNWSPWRDREWWLCFWWGFRQMIGLGNMAVHKRLDNLVELASFVDASHAELWSLEQGDAQRPPPPRSVWLRTVRRVDYKPRLREVSVPTLLCISRFDPQTPLVCTEELAADIPHAQVVIFEHSGHSPFIEEPNRFTQEVEAFLGST